MKDNLTKKFIIIELKTPIINLNLSIYWYNIISSVGFHKIIFTVLKSAIN